MCYAFQDIARVEMTVGIFDQLLDAWKPRNTRDPESKGEEGCSLRV